MAEVTKRARWGRIFILLGTLWMLPYFLPLFSFSHTGGYAGLYFILGIVAGIFAIIAAANKKYLVAGFLGLITAFSSPIIVLTSISTLGGGYIGFDNVIQLVLALSILLNIPMLVGGILCLTSPEALGKLKITESSPKTKK